jgi:hypothetical protein
MLVPNHRQASCPDASRKPNCTSWYLRDIFVRTVTVLRAADNINAQI